MDRVTAQFRALVVRVARHFMEHLMKILSELRRQTEMQILAEINTLKERLLQLDPKGKEFAIILSQMKKQINRLSDE